MTVLISKQNEKIIARLRPKTVFYEQTKNTSTFNISKGGMLRLFQKAMMEGFNPYALMYW